MVREAVAVSLPPVVRVTATSNTFPAAGSRQGQRRTLDVEKKKEEKIEEERMRLRSYSYHKEVKICRICTSAYNLLVQFGKLWNFLEFNLLNLDKTEYEQILFFF